MKLTVQAQQGRCYKKVDYDSKEYLKYHIAEIKNMINNKILEIEKMNDFKLKTICLYPLVEMFYQNEGSRKFDDFIEEFSSENMLKEIDPITLYYENFDKNNLKIDFLQQCTEYDWISIQKFEESKLIINQAKNNLKTRYFDDHKYSRLIYKWRSKLIHENSSPNTIFISMQNREVPIYYPQLETACGNLITNYKLIFPYTFLKKLFLNIIDNYLNFCYENEINPIRHKKDYLSWYEGDHK